MGWVKSQRFYRENAGDMYDKYITKLNRWPTANEYARENLGEICQMSAPDMVYLLRAMENKNRTGMKIGGLDDNVYAPKSDGHSINAVGFYLDNRIGAYAYYDPTPGALLKSGNFTTSVLFNLTGNSGYTGHAGAMGQVAIEDLVNHNCIQIDPDDNRFMGNGMRYPDGRYLLGENWSRFSLGNFVSYGVDSWQDANRRNVTNKLLRDPQKGWRVFDRYFAENQGSIENLHRISDRELKAHISGRQ
jgi:hypothetical protein